MIGFLRVFLSVLIVSALSSCHDTIHIHPDEEPVANEKVRLTLHIDNPVPQLGAVIDYTVSPAVIIYADNLPQNVIAHARTDKDSETSEQILQRANSLAEAFDQIAPYSPDGDKWELLLKYEVYAGTARQVKDGQIAPMLSSVVKYRADVSQPQHDVELEVPFGCLTVVAVAQFVPAGTDGDWFFNTDILYNIVSDIDRRQGEHDNIYRDCFVVGQEFDISPTGKDGNIQQITATLTRPQGRYMVIADDYETYLKINGTDITETVSHIHYPTYISIAYSVLDHLPVSSSFDFGYDFTPSLTYANNYPYVRLGDDWSFVNGDRSNFDINITVSDKKREHVINYNPGIRVPVFPGHVTLVVGHWLSETNEGGGGVQIDPDFTDEIVIHF